MLHPARLRPGIMDFSVDKLKAGIDYSGGPVR